MRDPTGWMVRSEAGRDKGEVFCVVGVDREGERLFLADGKRRKADRPKAKKPGHVTVLSDHQSMFDHPTIEKLRQGQPLTNKELRRAIAAFRSEMEE